MQLVLRAMSKLVDAARRKGPMNRFIKSNNGAQRWIPIIVFNVLILAGCATVGPDYMPPETTVAEDWHTPLNRGLIAEQIDPQALATWWTVVNDEDLSSLIERAVKGNLDIKEAHARIRESRARRGLARADRFPTLEAAGSATWSRTSEETGTGETDGFYAAGFDAG